MSFFTVKTWLSRKSEYPTRRVLTKEDGTTELVTVARNEGTISQEGDAFSDTNMNDLESRIDTSFQNVDIEIGPLNSLVTGVKDSLVNSINWLAKRFNFIKQSAVVNGILTDALVTDLSDPWADVNKPQMVLAGTTTINLPADCASGIREVFFTLPAKTLLLVITGRNTSSIPSTWKNSYTVSNNQWSGWISEVNSGNIGSQTVKYTNYAKDTLNGALFTTRGTAANNRGDNASYCLDTGFYLTGPSTTNIPNTGGYGFLRVYRGDAPEQADGDSSWRVQEWFSTGDCTVIFYRMKLNKSDWTAWSKIKASFADRASRSSLLRVQTSDWSSDFGTDIWAIHSTNGFTYLLDNGTNSQATRVGYADGADTATNASFGLDALNGAMFTSRNAGGNGRGDNADYMLDTGLYTTGMSTQNLPNGPAYGLLRTYRADSAGVSDGTASWRRQEWNSTGDSKTVYVRQKINAESWSSWTLMNAGHATNADLGLNTSGSYGNIVASLNSHRVSLGWTGSTLVAYVDGNAIGTFTMH